MDTEINEPVKRFNVLGIVGILALSVILAIILFSIFTGTLRVTGLSGLPDGAMSAIDKEVQSYSQTTGLQMAGYSVIQSQRGNPVQALIGTHRDEVWCVIMDLPNSPNITAVEREVFRYWILYRSNLYWQALRNVTVDVFRQNNCDIG